MDNQIDNENYWLRSTSKAFSFDDDVDDGTTASGQFAAGKWDTTNVHGSSGILSDDAISEASFDSSALGGSLNLSIKSVVNDEILQLILNEQTLDDRESYVSKGATAEEELKFLRRKIQTLLYHPSPDATAYKLLLGKNVSLEVFRSLHEKEQLLDAVHQIGAGDALIYVILFLKRTLNREQFHQVLLSRVEPLRHYISYLKQNSLTKEAIELLHLCGKSQEASLLQFQNALLCKDITKRKAILTQLIQQYKAASNMFVVPLYQQIFEASLKLTEFVAVEKQALSNRCNINSTPIEVLYICSSKHNNWKDTDPTKKISPYRISSEQQISPAQFEWTVLNERAYAQAYADLEIVFERASSWHPMKQKQFHISFPLEAAIWRLYELQAPTTVLYLFLSRMNSHEEKLAMAKRVKCTKAVIDALAGLKDAAQLSELYKTLAERSEEQFYCDKAIKGLQTKRWTTDNIKLNFDLMQK